MVGRIGRPAPPLVRGPFQDVCRAKSYIVERQPTVDSERRLQAPTTLSRMIVFSVPDMYSCRSIGAITKSVKAVDHEATVRIDMVRHVVAIESGSPVPELKRAIGRAGFTPRSAHPAPVSFDGTVDVLLPLDPAFPYTPG
jgi:copper chaperone